MQNVEHREVECSVDDVMAIVEDSINLPDELWIMYMEKKTLETTFAWTGPEFTIRKIKELLQDESAFHMFHHPHLHTMFHKLLFSITRKGFFPITHVFLVLALKFHLDTFHSNSSIMSPLYILYLHDCVVHFSLFFFFLNSV